MSAVPSKSPLNPDAEEWHPTAPVLIAGGSPVVPYIGVTCYPPFNYHPTCAYFYRTIRVPKCLPNREHSVGSLPGGGKKAAPICDRVEKKSRRKALPPRCRKSLRPFDSPVKGLWTGQEWRRIKSSQATETKSGDGDSTKTTVMIKNVPNKLRRGFLLKFLDEHCNIHCLAYDFLYLPMDFRKEGNLGYAFVNFTTNEGALKCKEILDNFKWKLVYNSSRKVCEVTWARIQGKEALIRRFTNSNFYCNDKEFLPVVLDPPRNGSGGQDMGRVIALGKLVRRRQQVK